MPKGAESPSNQEKAETYRAASMEFVYKSVKAL